MRRLNVLVVLVALANAFQPQAFAQDPEAPQVCLENAQAAFAQRLTVDAVWSNDPLAGAMHMRIKHFRIATHSMTSLSQGLARYRTPTVALVTYAGEKESCAWVVSSRGLEAYGRTARGKAAVRADVRAVIEALGVLGAMGARAPSPRGVASEPPSSKFTELRTDELASALAQVAETVMPGDVAAALLRYEAVIVVPHEELVGFPIALLPASRWAPTQYLSDSVLLEVSPALGEIGIGAGLHRNMDRDLATMTPEQRRTALGSAVVVGNPDFADAQFDMPPLPGAEVEARAVGAIFGVTPVAGAAAQRKDILQRVTERRALYVHFATHGWADLKEVTGNRSFVALSGGDRLTARDVNSWGIADGSIVVLSACQTGLGAARPGGVIGLPRAFQIGGAQTVVMSLWNVDDAATGALMRSFARHLLATGRPAHSLALAQRETRRDYPDPRKWASFVIFSAGPT